MKRSAMVAILGCIISLFIGLLAAAQAPTQTEQKKAPAPKAQKKAPAAKAKKAAPAKWKWEKLKNKNKTDEIDAQRRFTKLDACPAEKERKREVAILKLSDSQYTTFQRDAQSFVNDFSVFSCAVTGGLARKSKPAKTQAAPKGGDPQVNVTHEPNCGGSWYEM